MTRTRARVLVSGTVQGVAYRANTRDAARERGLDGWVRNLNDGRVEAVFEGPKEDVEGMIEWCRTGSLAADVQSVESESEEPGSLNGFEVKR
ncbi:acylphosphatase [Halobacteriales archaeon QH_6_64_20]|nr:MAG: acylphosphatase [Halobacteriales archaeon QH_6_64_20]